MANYTDAAKIAAHLGLTLTPEQAAQAEVAAEAVTAWIDHRTGRTWQANGPIVDEPQRVIGASIYLNRAPVASVEQLEWLDEGASPPSWVVVAPSNYSLTDPAHGVITVPGSYNGDSVQVDYTWTGSGAPPDLAYAATVISSELLFSTLHPESQGLSTLALGQNDISLKYANAAESTPAGSLAVRVIDAYRRVVLA